MTDQQFVTNTILEKYRAKGNKNKNDEEKDDDLGIGSPISIVNSPLAATRTQTNTIDSDSDTSDDVCEQTLIGNRVAAVLGDSLTHFGTIISCRISDDGKNVGKLYTMMSLIQKRLMRLNYQIVKICTTRKERMI